MKVGDLVRGGLGGIGVVIENDDGCVMVHWLDDGKRYAVNEWNLFPITVKKCP